MYGRATFERDVLTILLLDFAVVLGHDRYDHKLSNDVPLVSVSSFCEELWFRQSSSSCKKTKIFDFCDLICWKVFRSCFLETQEHPGKFALSCPGICRVLACPGKS